MQCLFPMFYFLFQVCFVYLVILIIKLQLNFSHSPFVISCHTSSRVSREQQCSCTCVGRWKVDRRLACVRSGKPNIPFRKSLKQNKFIFILSIFSITISFYYSLQSMNVLYSLKAINFLYKLCVQVTKAIAEPWQVWHDWHGLTLDWSGRML